MTEQADAVLTAWTIAEQAGDTRTPGATSHRRLLRVGPLGLILPKAAWLARHQDGGLACTA